MINTTEILEFINKNPWLNILFIILTLLSIFLSFWFYIKSRKAKNPSYAVRTFNLVREKINKIDSVDILYQGNKINNLSISKIAIWNAGKETINQTDIAANDKFRLELDSEKDILECAIIFEKNPACGFKLLKQNKNSIEIDFDYFDFNEGIILQLYHTANDNNSIRIKGSFKGVKQLNYSNSSRSLFPSIFYEVISRRPKLFNKVFGFISIMFPLFLFFALFFQNDIDKQELTFISKLILFTLVTIPYWWLAYKILKRRVPKGFNLFEGEF